MGRYGSSVVPDFDVPWFVEVRARGRGVLPWREPKTGHVLWPDDGEYRDFMVCRHELEAALAEPLDFGKVRVNRGFVFSDSIKFPDYAKGLWELRKAADGGVAKDSVKLVGVSAEPNMERQVLRMPLRDSQAMRGVGASIAFGYIGNVSTRRAPPECSTDMMRPSMMRKPSRADSPASNTRSNPPCPPSCAKMRFAPPSIRRLTTSMNSPPSSGTPSEGAQARTSEPFATTPTETRLTGTSPRRRL